MSDEIYPLPEPRMPVWFDLDKGMHDNLAEVARWSAHYLDKLGSGVVIDEAAIMVGPYSYPKVHDYLVDHEWDYFNAAADTVFTTPFCTRYGVRYRFYRHPQFAYRLEVMTLREGFSPLHEALWVAHSGDKRTDRRFPMPHLSYKPERTAKEAGGVELETLRRSYGRAVQHLEDNACIHVQSCQSTYGQFGYFIGNDTARQIYIKPRVNLRDAVMHSMCTVDSNDGCLAECGQLAPCGHAPGGVNHPKVASA